MPGIILLAYARASKKNKANVNVIARPAHRLEDYYRYNIGMVHRGSLAYKVTPLREGQLSGGFPQLRLYDTPAWKQYRRSAYSYLNVKKPTQFSGLQKGLLEDMNKGLNRKQY
jgi:hypothetical protein